MHRMSCTHCCLICRLTSASLNNFYANKYHFLQCPALGRAQRDSLLRAYQCRWGFRSPEGSSLICLGADVGCWLGLTRDGTGLPIHGSFTSSCCDHCSPRASIPRESHIEAVSPFPTQPPKPHRVTSPTSTHWRGHTSSLISKERELVTPLKGGVTGIWREWETRNLTMAIFL